MPLVRTTLLVALALTQAEVQTLPTTVRWAVAISAGPAAPPVLAGDQIFVVLQSGIVAAHRVGDGAEAWRVELRADQPVVVEGSRIFVAAADMIHALDAATGSVVWRAPSGPLSAPLVAQGGWLIGVSGDRLTAFRTDDGQEVWHRELGAQHLRSTIEGDNLYVPLDDGRLLALDLKTGADRWQKHFAGAPSEVLAFSDRIYVGAADKYFYCFDADDGEREWRTRVGAVLRGRPAGDVARVFITLVDNTLRAFDRISGKQLWHPSVPFRPASPVIVGSAIVVPGNSPELHAFDARSGRAAGQIKLEHSLVMPPSFGQANGAFIMAAVTGSLNAPWKLVLTGPPPPPAPPE